jgi:hypothetical protein
MFTALCQNLGFNYFVYDQILLMNVKPKAKEIKKGQNK